MFLGHSFHNLDDKGRLHLPSKFRSSLGEKVYVAVGLDSNLEIFTSQEMDKRMKYLESIPFGNKNARKFRNVFYGNNYELSVDKGGRINLPKELLPYANITKEVVISGNGSTVLIWDKDKFEKFNSENLPELENLAETISELDF